MTNFAFTLSDGSTIYGMPEVGIPTDAAFTCEPATVLSPGQIVS